MIESAKQAGYALVTMLVLLALLMGLILTHFSLTWIEMSTTRSSMDSFVGFYAAEAGLNVRADLVRQEFVGYGQPSGTSPSDTDPCTGTNKGSGDFACVEYGIQDRDVITWVKESSTSSMPMLVPRGENFRNLHGHEFHYIVYSHAIAPNGRPEAVLEMHFKSRTIPLFQFAVFYDKDLEALTGPDLILEGPVHSNRDVYVGSANTLDIVGQLTTAGNLYHGRKDADACLAGDVRVADPDTQAAIPACSGGRTSIAQSDVLGWNGMIDATLNPVTVPPPQAIDPTAGRPYWDRADVRIMLDLNGGSPAIEVRNANGTVNVLDTATLAACAVVGSSTSLYDRREGTAIDMLEVDVGGLLTCLHTTSLMGYDIDDATDGGLIWYLGVDGPDSAVVNSYGVRVKQGGTLASPAPTAPDVAGLTIVTDQALYIEGDYNAVDKIPAAFLADSLNVLSNNWNDANSALALSSRPATATTIHAALLAGTDTTGGADGTAGQDSGNYNGGLEGFMRLHEDWAGVTLTYLGSFVSLDEPRHVDGAWAYGDPYYTAPARAWSFDDDLEVPLLMPPLSPQLIYLRQELFVRQFEL